MKTHCHVIQTTLLLILAFSIQHSAFGAASDAKPSAAHAPAQHGPATITCPPSASRGRNTARPAEPYIVRYDPHATNFDEVPGPGLREDLRAFGETWPGVKFGPVKVGLDGRHQIFVSAHRSAWFLASDLPECIRTRLNIPVR